MTTGASRWLIGGRRFASAEAVMAAARAIRDATGAGEAVAEKHLPFLLALLAHHDEWEEKSAGGIDAVVVPRDGHGADRLRLRRTDDSAVDISFEHAVRCLSRGERAVRHADAPARAVRAARAEIAHQLVSFKREHLPPGTLCEAEGQPLLAVNVDVDHLAPATFETLLSGFCTVRGITLDGIETTDVDGRAARFADELLGSAWRRHHGEHARLGLITRVGHRRVAVETHRPD